jgi:hypothetical protein
MWQSSRPAALRVRNGGPKLRELTADELEQIQRAKDRAAEVERAAVLAAAAAGRARTRSGRRLEPLDLTLQPSTSGPPRPVRPQPDPSAVRRSHADLLPRPTSASRRPGSAPRGGSRPPSPRVEHVVIRAHAHPDVDPRRGHPPAPAPPPGSRPSSARPISARAMSHFDDDGCDLIEPMGDPIVPAGSKAVAASSAAAATTATTTTTTTRTGVFADDDDDDVEMLYVAPEWERERRGDADVLTLGVSSSSARGDEDRRGGETAGRAERRTAGGARVVNETPSLLDGAFDEEANRREFEAALREWRSGGDASPSGSPGKASPGTTAKAKAAAAAMETQTEAPGGSRRARPETAKPIVPRAGASYFERLYANNVERMAAKDAVDAMGDKRR